MAFGREDHGDGDPLVLLHGVATSRRIWRHVTGPLAATGLRRELGLASVADNPLFRSTPTSRRRR